MKSSFELLWDYFDIVMKSDEGFSDMLDKTILIDCLNENVIPFLYLRILKRRVFTRLFFAHLKNL